MALKTLDPEVVRKLTEGVEDVLTPAVQADAELYRKARCPRCFQSGYCMKKVDPPKVVPTPHGPELVVSPFSPSSPIVDGYAHCMNCSTEFCPRSGIIRYVEPFMTSVEQQDPQ